MKLSAKIKPRDPRPISELALHKNVITLLMFSAKPRVIYFHCPNGEQRSKRTGAKLKTMGVLPGVADIILVAPRGIVHFLELKRRGAPRSENQIAFADACSIGHVPYGVVDNFEDARAQLIAWDLLRPESMADIARKFNATDPSSLREVA